MGRRKGTTEEQGGWTTMGFIIGVLVFLLLILVIIHFINRANPEIKIITSGFMFTGPLLRRKGTSPSQILLAVFVSLLAVTIALLLWAAFDPGVSKFIGEIFLSIREVNA